MASHNPIPIDPAVHAQMNALAGFLDDVLNGDDRPKQIGFALLLYRFGEDLVSTHRINYIGNGDRGDVLVALKELVARWEGRYSETETTQ